MPPKSKFTKEEIVTAAFAIVERDGRNALTARSLASELKSSSRPIFTVFENMDEVYDCVLARARQIYDEGVARGLKTTPAFKGAGTSYIIFAGEHPELFRILFMSKMDNATNASDTLGAIDENYKEILSSIITGYNLNRAAALELYKHMWIYTHGIASLIATGTCAFTPEEISQMLTRVFKSLLMELKND